MDRFWPRYASSKYNNYVLTCLLNLLYSLKHIPACNKVSVASYTYIKFNKNNTSLVLLRCYTTHSYVHSIPPVLPPPSPSFPGSYPGTEVASPCPPPPHAPQVISRSFTDKGGTRQMYQVRSPIRRTHTEIAFSVFSDHDINQNYM